MGSCFRIVTNPLSASKMPILRSLFDIFTFFQIDEAMNWESVRNLRRMPTLLLSTRNICVQGKAPEDVLENIREVDEVLKEVLSEFIT